MPKSLCYDPRQLLGLGLLNNLWSWWWTVTRWRFNERLFDHRLPYACGKRILR
jgi:hypothetical protein